MNSTIRRASLGLLLGASACFIPTMAAQTGPVLEARMYAGITITGAVNTAYAIQATTNLADTNGWRTLATVVLTNSPWLFFDTNSPGMARRYYRAVGTNTNTPPDTNAPAGMVLIPAGPFQMGDAFGEGKADELPVHTVQVGAFYMDKYEVTKALWNEVFQWAVTHGYNFDHPFASPYLQENTYFLSKGLNYPVTVMTVDDMFKWCNARSEKEGRVPAYYTDATQKTVYRTSWLGRADRDWVKWNAGYRLPTEAEWEKAARGGLEGKRFPWGDTITHSQANYYSSSYFDYDISPTRGWHPSYDNEPQPYTSPVGSFAPNGYGLYDMAGNVSEACWDWYGPYSSGSQTDTRGPAWGSYRVGRGGDYGSAPPRLAARQVGLGECFRSVLSPDQ